MANAFRADLIDTLHNSVSPTSLEIMRWENAIEMLDSIDEVKMILWVFVFERSINTRFSGDGTEERFIRDNQC